MLGVQALSQQQKELEKKAADGQVELEVSKNSMLIYIYIHAEFTVHMSGLTIVYIYIHT